MKKNNHDDDALSKKFFLELFCLTVRFANDDDSFQVLPDRIELVFCFCFVLFQ